MPRSPTVVSKPRGKVATSLSSRATAARPRAIRVLRVIRVIRVAPEGDVAGDRVGEEKRLLRHEADRAAQAAERDLADVDAADRHGARRRLVQPRQQVDQRRLAGAGAADERDRLARLDAEADVASGPAGRCPDR